MKRPRSLVGLASKLRGGAGIHGGGKKRRNKADRRKAKQSLKQGEMDR